MNRNTPGARGAVDFDAARVDAIFAHLDQGQLPGAAVGIALGGKPLYRRGFGLANMELPVALSPSIRIRVASITKQFASLAYLLLCERGAARLDEPVGRYLPEIHPVMHSVTMRQLMGSIGGLRDAHEVCFLFSGIGRRVTGAELLALYREIDDLNAAPGSTWIFNHGGWLMLSFAIERITERPLEEALRDLVFDPIGMYDTALRRSDLGFMPNSATSHMADGAGGYRRADWTNTEFAAESGAVSTVDDMLRWMAHLRRPLIGSDATWEAWRTPLTLANGTSTGYGLGIVNGRYHGLPTLFHSGGGAGGNAMMIRVPDADLDVVVLVNRHEVSGALLAERVLDACLPGNSAAAKDMSVPTVSGTFRSRVTGRVVQLGGGTSAPWTQGGRQVASIDAMDMLIEPDESGTFWPVGMLGYVRQGITPVGVGAQPEAVRFSDFGTPDLLERVEAPREPSVASIAGRYRWDATGTDAEISEAANGPTLRTLGRWGSVDYPMHCLGEGLWRVMSTSVTFLGGVLVFEPEARGFRFSSAMTRSLPFRRIA